MSAALHRQPEVLAQVHSVLWHRAAHCFEAGSCAAAKELFSAAFQFARPEARSKGARALAACHSRLGMHQRAVEYLDIAARHEQQPSSLTQLARLQELALTGDGMQVRWLSRRVLCFTVGHAGSWNGGIMRTQSGDSDWLMAVSPLACLLQAVATISSLASACADFHPSLIAAMCQAAAKAQHPAVQKEALGTAVQLLVKAEAPNTTLPAGQEAALLLAHVQAIDACLKAGPAAAEAAAAAGSPAVASGGGSGALYSELVAAVKLATRRLKLLGWERFVGGSSAGKVRWQGGRQLLLKVLALVPC